MVAVSFGLQVWSQHSETFGRFLKSSFMPITDCLWLLLVAGIPLLVLEIVKLARPPRRDPPPLGQPVEGTTSQQGIPTPPDQEEKP